MEQTKFVGTTDPDPQPYEIAHAEISRRAAEEGIVLLKNEGGILPLRLDRPVALFGGGAVRTIKGGRGSGEVNDRYCVNIYDGMKNAGFSISTERWLDEYGRLFDRKREEWRNRLMELGEDAANGIDFFERYYSQNPFERPEDLPAYHTDADVAIYVISRTAGEAADRAVVPGDYLLTSKESELLHDIAGLYRDVIVVLNTGGVIDLSFLDEVENIRGLIYLSQPGMEGGNALANILSGKVSPSGKLSDTWARSYSDYPNSDSYAEGSSVDKILYHEGIYVGYRYFDTFRVPVRFGFGYGLSYTQFTICTCSVSQNQNLIHAEIEVANIGNCSGREVVQLYISSPAMEQDKELRCLVAFGKTKELLPGEKEVLKLSFDARELTSYNEEESSWVLEAGNYIVWAGASLDSSRIVAILEQPTRVEQKCQPICRCELPFSDLKTAIRDNRLPDEECADLIKVTLSGIRLNNPEKPSIHPKAVELAESLELHQILDLVVGDGQIADEADPYYSECIAVGAGGMITSDVIPDFILCDGPAGVRLSASYEVKDGRAKKKSMRDCVEGGIFAKPLELPYEEIYYQYCTSVPVGTMLAQTWNMELLEQVGIMIAEELSRFNISVWLAPGMNIHRNPLCGRNFEYYSEDPVLTGLAASAVVRGIQAVPGCCATLKHFACNSREDNRMHSDSIISERALREIYCKGFELAIKNAKPAAIMTAYNKVNGTHCANSYDLCTKLARQEWGYEGLFMCDWTSTIQGGDCTAAGCVLAGCDMSMPGFESDRISITQALENGTLCMKNLQECAARVIQMAMK